MILWILCAASISCNLINLTCNRPIQTLDLCAGFQIHDSMTEQVQCFLPDLLRIVLCLYFKKERKTYLRFALVFLFVNLIGFAGYYIHPAAPP